MVVVGAGIAGLSAAFSLLKGGLPPNRILLLEAGAIGEGDSVRHSGILNPAFSEPYGRLRSSLGKNAARLKRFSYRNLERMISAGEQFEFDWELELPGFVQAAGSEQEEDELIESVPLLRADGFSAEFLTPGDLSSRIGFKTPWGGIFDERGGGGHPVQWLHGMARGLIQRGVRVHTSSPVTQIFSRVDGTVELLIAGANSICVRSECAILAWNTYALDLDANLANYVFPRSAQLLCFPPNPLNKSMPVRPLQPSVHYQFGQFRIRRIQDGRLIFSCYRHQEESKRGSALLAKNIQEQLLKFVRSHFPELKNQTPEIQWEARQACTVDGLPLIGPHPSIQGALLCLGFNGSSFNLAAEAGNLCSELVLNGTASDADLFSPRRLL